MRPSGHATDDRRSVAFAAAAAAIVTTDDTLGTITRLLIDAGSVVRAAGVGLVVTRPDGALELLAATSHRAEELELFQLQAESGPCVDAIRTGVTVDARGRSDIARRWPGLSGVIEAAGYQTLHASPMRWRGRILGAVNFFWGDERDTDEQHALIRGYTDIATIAIVQTGSVSEEEIRDRTLAVLTSRHLVEQAKGALAYRDGIDTQTAYERLLQYAAERGITLAAAAAAVVDEAVAQPGRRHAE